MSESPILLCGQNIDKSVEPSLKAIYSIYIIAVTCIFISIGSKLLKSLQMFPIKEKSGKLILLFCINNYMFLMSYPILLIINLDFKDYNKQYQPISGFLRFLFNIYVVTYLMRALRISYAYNVGLKMQGILYKIIKNENICCLLTIILGIILFWAPESFLRYKENIFNFQLDQNIEIYKDPRVQKILVVGFDQLVLLLSLFLIRRAQVELHIIYKQSTFKIQSELLYTILLECVAISAKQILLTFVNDRYPCYESFPYYYAIDSLKIFIQLWITVAIPLLQVKKVPEHFPYAIIADNFELFMSEPVCIKLFHDFLIYYDKRHTLITEQLFNVQDNSTKVSQLTDNEKLINDERIINQTGSIKFHESLRQNSEFEEIKNLIDLTQMDQRLQTVECYILWMDLTLIFAKHNALDQNYPSNDELQLESEIIDYIINLLNNVNLRTMMPNKLAQEIESRFNQCKQVLEESDQNSSKLIKIVDSMQIDRQYHNSVKIVFSNHGSQVYDESEQDGNSYVGVLQLAYEIRYLMFEIISKIFIDDYQRTISFETIRKQFILNEKIQFRLYNLNLTKEFK